MGVSGPTVCLDVSPNKLRVWKNVLTVHKFAAMTSHLRPCTATGRLRSSFCQANGNTGGSRSILRRSGRLLLHRRDKRPLGDAEVEVLLQLE